MQWWWVSALGKQVISVERDLFFGGLSSTVQGSDRSGIISHLDVLELGFPPASHMARAGRGRKAQKH